MRTRRRVVSSKPLRFRSLPAAPIAVRADVLSNIGLLKRVDVVLLRQGKVPEAVDHFREALCLRPDFAPARKNLEQLAATVQP